MESQHWEGTQTLGRWRGQVLPKVRRIQTPHQVHQLLRLALEKQASKTSEVHPKKPLLKDLSSDSPTQEPKLEAADPRPRMKEAHLLILKQQPEGQAANFTCTFRSLLEHSLGTETGGASFVLSFCCAPEPQYLPEGSFYIQRVP